MLTFGSLVSHRRRSMGCAVAGVLAATALAACGSDSKSSSGTSTTTKAASTPSDASSGVADAQAAVQEARGPTTYEPVATPLDISGVKGKSVWSVNPTLSIPVLQAFNSAWKQAFAAAGVNFHPVDGQGSVANYNKAIEQAVKQKASAILTTVDPTLVAGAVKDANKAGVKVIPVAFGLPGQPSKVPGAENNMTWDYRIPGKLLADWFIADSKGKGNGVLFSSDDYSVSKIEKQAFQDEVKAKCPGCKVTVADTTIPQWQSRLPVLARTALQKDPNINYFLPLFDAMTLSIEPALQQSNAAGKVKMASFNASPPVMAELQKPASSVKADIGNSNYWFGYAAADNTFRLLLDKPTIPDYKIGFRVFDAANTKGFNFKAGEQQQAWYGQEYWPEFQKVWGLSS